MQPTTFLLSLIALAGSASAKQSPPSLLTFEQAKLTASDPGEDDEFGVATALSGNTAVVGALTDDHSGFKDAGSAYVFVRGGTGWTMQAKLTAWDAAASDFFGGAVAIDGDTLVVGASGDDLGPSPFSQGSAYVFVRAAGEWKRQAKLTALSGSSRFGISVAVSGNTAMVGSHLDHHSGLTDAGSVFVFERTGTTWSQTAELHASDAAANDQFGSGVALSQGSALIGAWKDDHAGGFDAGSAYVFVFDGVTGWSEQAKLTATDAGNGDLFGSFVDLDGDTAVAGAYLADHSGLTNAGAAYVFARTGSLWAEQSKLISGSAEAFDWFGSSVGVSGDTAVVGAIFAGNGLGVLTGSVSAFRRAGSVWWEAAEFSATDGESLDNFGSAVGVIADTLVVGASGGNHSGLSAPGPGAAYVIRLLPEPVVYCTAKPGLTCGTTSIAAFGVPSASASSGFTIRARPVHSNKSGIMLYTNAGRAAQPFMGGTLCLDSTQLRRSPAIGSGGVGVCDGELSIDVNGFASGSLGGNPQAFLGAVGQQVDVQWWGRDSIPTGSLLSAAVEYFVGP